MSSSMHTQSSLLTLLSALEVELKFANLWAEVAPSPDLLKRATSEGVPFGYHVMGMETWLQFIFVPTIRHMIKNHQPLPTSVAILPAAQTQWGASQHPSLLACIASIDDYFCHAEDSHSA